MAKTVTLHNDFHHTSTRVIPRAGRLSERQVARARRALCCSGCTCSGRLGTRGPQEVEFEDEFFPGGHIGGMIISEEA